MTQSNQEKFAEKYEQTRQTIQDILEKSSALMAAVGAMDDEAKLEWMTDNIDSVIENFEHTKTLAEQLDHLESQMAELGVVKESDV